MQSRVYIDPAHLVGGRTGRSAERRGYGKSWQMQATRNGEGQVSRKSRVDLDQLGLAVARVDLQLDLGRAAPAPGLEQGHDETQMISCIGAHAGGGRPASARERSPFLGREAGDQPRSPIEQQ